MAERVTVCVGTRKGLFVLESDARRQQWKMKGPFLRGWSVYHAVVDTRGTPRIHAAASSAVFATTVMSSDVSRLRFRGARCPPVPPKLLASHLKVAGKYGIPTSPRVWHIEPGRVSEKKVLYAGTAPAALFRSDDDGATWEEVRSLTNHPSRRDWQSGFGGMCLHSIQLDPTDGNRMIVAISAAGAFRTDDGAKTWKPANHAVARYVGAPKNRMVGT